jgi:hypothetical protein
MQQNFMIRHLSAVGSPRFAIPLPHVDTAVLVDRAFRTTRNVQPIPAPYVPELSLLLTLYAS